MSYRQGYFARPSAHTQRLKAAKTKTKGSFTIADAPPNVSIVFEARVQLGETEGSGLEIAYAIAASDLSFRAGGNGERQARFKVAAMSYDTSGQVKTHSIEAITTHYSEAQLDTARRIGVPVVKNLPLRSGAKFALLTIIDLETGRTGILQFDLSQLEEARKDGVHIRV